MFYSFQISQQTLKNFFIYKWKRKKYLECQFGRAFHSTKKRVVIFWKWGQRCIQSTIWGQRESEKFWNWGVLLQNAIKVIRKRLGIQPKQSGKMSGQPMALSRRMMTQYLSLGSEPAYHWILSFQDTVFYLKRYEKSMMEIAFVSFCSKILLDCQAF